MSKYLTWNAGGWVAPGLPYKLQRVDQGQDFEIGLGHHLVAPGPGVVVGYSNDRPWPNGFGSPYAIVKITHGRFGGRTWYIGHVNADVPPVGHKFKTGDKLGRPNHSLNPGMGWSEIGEWLPGPGPMGHGAQFAHLFTPLRRRV